MNNYHTNYKPLVSIVIPVFNGASFLNEAIDSALNQTYPNIEIIVVNDGSEDEGKTEAIAQSYGDKIRYFTKENGGCGTALNLAIREMNGDFFSWLSHDDVYLPNKIEWQLECHMQLANKDSIVFGSFNLIDEGGKFLAASTLHKHSSIDKLNTPLYPLLNGLIHGCSLLIPSHLFKKFGIFNEEKRTTQDYDLWFRFARQVPFVYDHETLIKSRVHPNQDTQKLNALHLRECNELWSGFILGLSAIEKSNLYGSEYLFLKKMSDHLGITPYSEASKLATVLYHDYVNSVKVSVIIPVNNNLLSSLLAIDSVINQSHSNLEILVIGYGEKCKISNLKSYAKSDQRITLLADSCKTATEAINLGVTKSTGSFVTFLFEDNIYQKEKIEVQLGAMLNSNCGFSICQEYECDIELSPLKEIEENSGDGIKISLSELLPLSRTSISTAMIKSSIAKTIKFDECNYQSCYPKQIIEIAQYELPLVLNSALVAKKIVVSNEDTYLDSLTKNIYLNSEILNTLVSKKLWQHRDLSEKFNRPYLLNLINDRLELIVLDCMNKLAHSIEEQKYNSNYHDNLTTVLGQRLTRLKNSISYADIEGYIVGITKPIIPRSVYKILKVTYHKIKENITNK